MGEIRIGIRVTAAFGAASLDGLNLVAGDVEKRRNNACGTVESAIAGSNGQAFWVLLDRMSAVIPRSRQQQAQENPAVEEAISRRQNRAPYWASELNPTA